MALAACAVMAVAGLLMAVPRVFIGHPSVFVFVSFSSFAILGFGLPPTLILCNVAAYQQGGRRVLRCLAITTTILGGLALAGWLCKSHVPPHAVFHGDGRITFSYTSVRTRGLIAATVSLAIPAVAAWLIVRPTKVSAEAVVVRT